MAASAALVGCHLGPRRHRSGYRISFDLVEQPVCHRRLHADGVAELRHSGELASCPLLCPVHPTDSQNSAVWVGSFPGLVLSPALGALADQAWLDDSTVELVADRS